MPKDQPSRCICYDYWRLADEGHMDRLDTELLKRAFLGWLRGEPDHCSMAADPDA